MALKQAFRDTGELRGNSSANVIDFRAPTGSVAAAILFCRVFNITIIFSIFFSVSKAKLGQG